MPAKGEILFLTASACLLSQLALVIIRFFSINLELISTSEFFKTWTCTSRFGEYNFSFLKKTCKCKLIQYWMIRAVWLLINNINTKKFAWKCQKIFLELSLSYSSVCLAVHTYPDIFESATFSFRIQKFPRPHVAYSNRIFSRPHASDGIRIHSSTQGSSALKCLQSVRRRAR